MMRDKLAYFIDQAKASKMTQMEGLETTIL